MKVSYEEGLANHFGLQRRGESGDRSVLSVRAKGNAGQPLSSEITTSVCRSCLDKEKATSLRPRLARLRRTRRSQRTGACVDIPNARTGRSLWFPLAMRNDDSRQWNDQSLNHRRSRSRKGTQPRGTTCKPTCPELRVGSNASPADCPACPVIDTQAARKDSQLKFTALLHHVNCELLHEAFFNLKKSAAVGIDQVTWHAYERNVAANIVDLHERIHDPSPLDCQTNAGDLSEDQREFANASTSTDRRNGALVTASGSRLAEFSRRPE